MARVTALNVNGKKMKVDVDSSTSLLTVLRDNLNLTGSKYGCGEGQCGACSVLLDGEVETLAEREDAARVVRHLTGVAAIVNHIRVKNDTARRRPRPNIQPRT